MSLSNHKFLTHAAIATIASSSIQDIISATIHPNKKEANNKYSVFKENNTLVFQGDSITDAGRDRKDGLPNQAHTFGNGYAYFAASALLDKLSNMNFTLYNRGISGNKVYQLMERWQKECIDLNPDIVSILIGVNDYWHSRGGDAPDAVEAYLNDYRALLQFTKEKLPQVQFIIGEPFYVLNTSAVDESWIEPMKGYQAVAKKIAEEFDSLWVPFQKVFDEAVTQAPATYWTEDGVHPTISGAKLMAQAWLKVVKYS